MGASKFNIEQIDTKLDLGLISMLAMIREFSHALFPYLSHEYCTKKLEKLCIRKPLIRPFW